AGIGGLTLAIALRQYGILVDIYEQTTELREVGAAVALSANGTRFFDQCGVSAQLGSHWFEVSALIYRDGRTGRLIGKHDAGPAYRQRFGAPYVGIHRADLQAILSEAVGLDRIRLRKRLVDIDDTGTRAALRFDDGSTAEAAWSSAPTAHVRSSGAGCSATTTRYIPAAAASAASCRWTRSRV